LTGVVLGCSGSSVKEGGGDVFNVNVDVTVVATVIDTVHVPVLEQPPPDQPANVEVGSVAAVSVTLVPWLYVSAQSVPQLIPAGMLVTVPVPVPAFDTVSLSTP
jgi:hypothetical protein